MEIAEKRKIYEKLLNNLLDIKGRDQATFTKVDGVKMFDVYTKFGPDAANKVLSQKIFNFALTETDLAALLKEVKNASEGQTVINAYEKYSAKLFSSKKLLLKDPSTFEDIKQELVEKLKLDIAKQNSRWELYIREIKDINIQENIYPLHIATLFISIATNDKTIYGPLLLREVEISVGESKINLSSTSDWKINEKLIFLLGKGGFLPSRSLGVADLNDLSGLEAIDLVLAAFSLDGSSKIVDKFLPRKREEIKNLDIHVDPGVVLGLYRPAGGHLREAMIQIIDKDEIDDIIDVEVDKTIYQKRVMEFMVNSSQDLVRVQESNYSQDKAMSSALIQDTIIWGPPGTGKSQVIANLIANILKRGQSAVIMSQKKAALDVLRQRLGEVAPFVLFVLNDNKLKKEEFYKPLQQFVNLVETMPYKEVPKGQKIIDPQAVAAIDSIVKAREVNSYDPSLNLFEIFGQQIPHSAGLLFKLNPGHSYINEPVEFNEYLEKTAAQNNVVKSGFWLFKNYPKQFRQEITDAYELLNTNQNIDLNKVVSLASQTSFETISNLYMVPQVLEKPKNASLNGASLLGLLSDDLRLQIQSWKKARPELYKEYKAFAAAVRAGRALQYKFVNKHMNVIRILFKIIITTPETSFINWEKKSFDYAILDESSQIFLEIGLPIVYLAKTKVLAGDLEQMQPSRWFETRDDDDGEEDIPENAESLLRYASDKGVFNVMLNQNFRSYNASLMSFSSKNFYNSDLEVVDRNWDRKRNSFEVINVNGVWDSGINVVEVDKVVELTRKNFKDYDKIIILTFNSPQQQLIEKKIIESEPLLFAAMDEEKLLIRNIENIQGDEADLVVASVIYDSTTNMGATYVSRPGGKNALNVAISRAKEKMIVVKSVRADTIKPAKTEDFKVFKEWLAFLDLPEDKKRIYSLNEKIEESYGDTESDFEREVLDQILANVKTNGHMQAVKQYEVGSKRIDIAIMKGSKFILGIEVDGYRYHDGQGIDKHLEDISRQEFLESKGYDIFRVTEIDWKINKAKVLDEISALVNK